MTTVKINGRDTRGRFRKTRTIGLVLILTAMFILLAHALIVGPALGKEIKAGRIQAALPVIVPVAHADITMEAKVEALKDQIVTDLAAKCETREVSEPDAAIILDSNNQMSIGSWMYQIKTVQHYVKKFEGRDISRVEAIAIAIDHEKARTLTKRIIFEEQSGLENNWTNCARILGLSGKVAVINELTK